MLTLPQKNTHWSIDNTWYAPAWKISNAEWIITWTKQEELIESGEYEEISFKYKPYRKGIKENPILVIHANYGEGLAYDMKGSDLIVKFKDEDEDKIIGFDKVKHKKPILIKAPLDIPIVRLFYIQKEKDSKFILKAIENESITNTIYGNEVTIDEIIRSYAILDDLDHLVKTKAPWRDKPASPKQQQLLHSYSIWGKLGSLPDDLSSGNASSLIDQVKKRENIVQVINKVIYSSNE